ncbi:Reverse transcriptase [Theobroma cacao]|nr:Reverse transcriptase [Theobroma cacao]
MNVYRDVAAVVTGSRGVSGRDKLDQFTRNSVWSLVPRPSNHPIVGIKWVFRNKVDEQGNVVRNKARLVAQRYNQEEGIDYDETFSPVATIEAIRLLLAFACFMNFKLYQMDGEFEMSMMGELKYFLGLQIKQSEEKIFINQERYTQDMLKKFDMLKLKPISTPMSSSTRLDLDEKGKIIDQKLYRDADFAGSKTDRKSTSGTCQFLGQKWKFELHQPSGSLVDGTYLQWGFSECKKGKDSLRPPRWSWKRIQLACSTRGSIIQILNEVIFNIFLRIEGKLTDQGERLQNIEEKIIKLENDLKKKEKEPFKLVAADTSATPSTTLAQQGVEGLAELAKKSAPHGGSHGIQAEGSTYKSVSPILQTEDSHQGVDQPAKTPSLELQSKNESEQGTEVVGSKTKKQQASPPNSEEISIMDIFHQMVREGQAEKDTARTETQKDGGDIGKGKKPTSAPRVKEKSGKEKATATPPTEAKAPTKGKKTMATKIAFLNRRKSSRLAEKSKPISASSS